MGLAESLLFNVRFDKLMPSPECNLICRCARSPDVYNMLIYGDALSQGQLVPLLEDYAPLGLPMAVVYAQRRYQSAKVTAFVEFVNVLTQQLRQKHIVD